MCTVKDYVNKSVTPNTSNAGDASIEELDRMLEDDALALLNIRKEF
jgi:hypothetical protein